MIWENVSAILPQMSSFPVSPPMVFCSLSPCPLQGENTHSSGLFLNFYYMCALGLSHSVVSDSLWPHGL